MSITALSGDEERASLAIDGAPWEVLRLDGREGVSRLFEFRLVCRASAAAPAPRTLIGGAAVITLRDGFGAERRIHGVVAEAESRAYDSGEAEVVAVVRPRVYPLTLGRDSKDFRDMTVVQIVEEVLAGSTAPRRWELGAIHPPHVYCAQYREDDWTFVSRLLEEEGVYYWFDHDGEETTLVFADSSPSAPDLIGGAYIPFIDEWGMLEDRESVEELGAVVQATPTKFSVGSFDPDHPLFKLGATLGEGRFEVYDAAGGGPESPARCEAQARILREAAIAAGAQIRGASSSIRLVPGMTVEIGGHPLARLDGRYLVLEASYTLRQRGGLSGGERPYVCRFRGLPSAAPFRPPHETPLARQAGLQSGVVIGPPGEEVHTDPSGRVRVQLHWDRKGQRDDASGKWMRVAQRCTAASMLLPRVGWNVMSLNDEGTVDAPSVLSRIHDAEHPPTYALPANKTRVTYKTATTPGGGSFNEVHFEDKKGSEVMFLNASRDMSVLVQNLKNEVVARDSSREVGVDHEINVAIDQRERVVKDQVGAIGRKEELLVDGDRQKTVQGNESVKIAGKRSLKTGDAHQNSVVNTRELKVGAALIDVTLGNIAAQAGLTHILVGGAAVKLSAKSIEESVKRASVQAIGGAKIEIATKDRPLTVKGRTVETVGGAMVLKTDKGFSDKAEETWSLTAGISMTAEAPDVFIEASDKIEIRCGASVITVTASDVEIKSTAIDLSSSANLEAIAAKIEHN